MGARGFEPRTSPLSGVRSSHLSNSCCRSPILLGIVCRPLGVIGGSIERNVDKMPRARSSAIVTSILISPKRGNGDALALGQDRLDPVSRFRSEALLCDLRNSPTAKPAPCPPWCCPRKSQQKSTHADEPRNVPLPIRNSLRYCGSASAASRVAPRSSPRSVHRLIWHDRRSSTPQAQARNSRGRSCLPSRTFPEANKFALNFLDKAREACLLTMHTPVFVHVASNR